MIIASCDSEYLRSDELYMLYHEYEKKFKEPFPDFNYSDFSKLYKVENAAQRYMRKIREAIETNTPYHVPSLCELEHEAWNLWQVVIPIQNSAEKTPARKLWYRLYEGLNVYLKNYVLHLQNEKVPQALAVDYEIDSSIMSYIEESLQGDLEAHKNDANFVWYVQIMRCEDINTLPEPLQKLVLQYLPKFFAQYPEYENEPCLQIRKGLNKKI